MTGNRLHDRQSAMCRQTPKASENENVSWN
jgi:hypothetical protein